MHKHFSFPKLDILKTTISSSLLIGKMDIKEVQFILQHNCVHGSYNEERFIKRVESALTKRDITCGLSSCCANKPTLTEYGG